MECRETFAVNSLRRQRSSSRRRGRRFASCDEGKAALLLSSLAFRVRFFSRTRRGGGASALGSWREGKTSLVVFASDWIAGRASESEALEATCRYEGKTTTHARPPPPSPGVPQNRHRGLVLCVCVLSVQEALQTAVAHFQLAVELRDEAEERSESAETQPLLADRL